MKKKNERGLPFPSTVEHSQVSVCVFQYSPDRSATPLRVWMGATATSGMEATPATANTDTGGSTVKKVALLIKRNICINQNITQTCTFLLRFKSTTECTR